MITEIQPRTSGFILRRGFTKTPWPVIARAAAQLPEQMRSPNSETACNCRYPVPADENAWEQWCLTCEREITYRATAPPSDASVRKWLAGLGEIEGAA